MTPFALSSPSQFLPSGPPSVTSPGYAQDLNEVETLGSAASTTRTPEQTQTAVFWQTDAPAAMWNGVAVQLADTNETTLTQDARLLALMNIAPADATAGVWNAKNTYNFWRPITAIQTVVDPTWTPLLPTPVFQEYPSGHSGLSNAAASVLPASTARTPRSASPPPGFRAQQPGLSRRRRGHTAPESTLPAPASLLSSRGYRRG
jgi:hypothetical protein